MLFGTALYRALLRECRQLPDAQVQLHYRDKIRTSFRRPVPSDGGAAAAKRVKGHHKLLRQLQAVNDGYIHALKRAIDVTYARRGPDRHASLRPFTHPTPRTRNDHAFPPALAALLKSPISHTARPPNSSQLISPPKFGPRADTTSEEARLLGPMIPQRIQAVKRRYWNEQIGKVRPPMATFIERSNDGDAQDDGKALRAAQIGWIDMKKGQDSLLDLESKARVPANRQPRLPRRLQTADERAIKGPTPSSSTSISCSSGDARVIPPSLNASKWHRPKILSTRLLRRRFQDVLSRSPILTVRDRGETVGASTKESQTSKKSSPSQNRFHFEVTLSEARLDGLERVPEVDQETLQWIQHEAGTGRKGTKSRRPLSGGASNTLP